ncbi:MULTISPECIES: hypothetical protein [Oceanobacillus]|uniref:hypothetical protein n=1 Tax=Oceanobacillus TaxID=182709 RepID=UPI000595BB34|nr:MULTISPECIES: hypothetical protein [Oceanobacillus]
MLKKEYGNCFSCDCEIDADTIYCFQCYKNICTERKEFVLQLQLEGLSFNAACSVVARLYNVDKEDVEFLFE